MVDCRDHHKEIIYEISLPRPKNKPFGYPKNPRNIHERIKKARMDRGLQVRELAEILGCHSCTVTNWEKGRSAPVGEMKKAVEEFLE